MEFNQVTLPCNGFTWFHSALLDWTGFYRVFTIFTGFYWIPKGFLEIDSGSTKMLSIYLGSIGST